MLAFWRSTVSLDRVGGGGGGGGGGPAAGYSAA
jgi:hypothetical protein